jgi:hypothetical protein
VSIKQDRERWIQNLSLKDSRLLAAEDAGLFRGNPFQRLRRLQRAVLDLVSYLQFQNRTLIQIIAKQVTEQALEEYKQEQESLPRIGWKRVNEKATPIPAAQENIALQSHIAKEQLYQEASGSSSNKATSTPEETHPFYLTFMASSMVETAGSPMLLALTASQVATLTRIMERDTKVLCSLVTQHGIPLVEGMYMTRIHKEGIRRGLSELPIQRGSGVAGDEQSPGAEAYMGHAGVKVPDTSGSVSSETAGEGEEEEETALDCARRGLVVIATWKQTPNHVKVIANHILDKLAAWPSHSATEAGEEAGA